MTPVSLPADDTKLLLTIIMASFLWHTGFQITETIKHNVMAPIFPMLGLNCLSLMLHFNQVHVQCC